MASKPERIPYLHGPDLLAVLQVLGHEQRRLLGKGGLDDQCVPEGELRIDAAADRLSHERIRHHGYGIGLEVLYGSEGDLGLERPLELTLRDIHFP